MIQKHTLLTLTCAAALTVASVPADAYPGSPWRVNPMPGAGNFEVIDGTRPDNNRIWCAAGDYALRRLNAKGTTRIYLTHPNGRARTQSTGRGTGFTINPSQDILNKSIRGGEDGNYSVSVRKVGYNFSVSRARTFCDFDIFSW